MGFSRKPQTPEDRAKAHARKRARDKRKALSRIRKLSDSDAEFSGWEGEFLGSLEERLETYDAAFRSPEKGAPDAALSHRQKQKLKEIAAKERKSDAPGAEDDAPPEERPATRLRLVKS